MTKTSIYGFKNRRSEIKAKIGAGRTLNSLANHEKYLKNLSNLNPQDKKLEQMINNNLLLINDLKNELNNVLSEQINK